MRKAAIPPYRQAKAIGVLMSDLPTRLDRLSLAQRATSLVLARTTLEYALPTRGSGLFPRLNRDHRLRPELCTMLDTMLSVRKSLMVGARSKDNPELRAFAFGQLTGMDVVLVTFGRTIDVNPPAAGIPPSVKAIWQSLARDVGPVDAASAVRKIREFEMKNRTAGVPLKRNGDSYTDGELTAMARVPDYI